MSPLRDVPLRIRLVVALVLSSLVPLAILAFWSIRDTRARAWDTEIQLLGARADQLVAELDRFHEGYRRAVERLANIAEVVEYLEAPSAQRTPVTPRLAIHQNHDAAVRGVSLFDRDGIIVASTQPDQVGRDRKFRGYVQRALAGEHVVSDPYLADSDDPTIAYASPVRRADGTIIGITVFWVHAKAFWAIASKVAARASHRSFAIIADSLGIQIADTHDPSELFHPMGPLTADERQRLLAERRWLGRTQQLIDAVEPYPVLFAHARGPLGPDLPLLETTSTGPLVAIGRRSQVTRWSAFFIVPRTAISGPIAERTRGSILFASVVAAIALLVGVVFAASLLRPIRRLTEVTRKIADGDLGARVAQDRGAELGMLQRSFNTMASELAANRDDLERTVAERTKRYRDLYDGAPDMYLTAAMPSGEIIDCNEALLRATGYSREELIGRSVAMMYTGESVAEYESNRARFADMSPILDAERLVRRKDGTTIEVSLHLQTIHDDSNAVVGARAIWRDITRRKRAERERSLLLRLGERMRAAFGSHDVEQITCTELAAHLAVSSCVFVHDVEELPSLTQDQRTAIDRGEVVVEDTNDGPAWIAVPRTRDGQRTACLLLTSMTSRTWHGFEVSLVRLVAENAWMWIDHHDLIAARSETRFRTVIDGVRDYAIYMLDPSGRVATWNEGCVRVYATDRSIVGQPLPRLPGQDSVANMLVTAARTGRYETDEWRVRGDGARFWANVVITPILDDKHQLEGFAEIVRDQSERRVRDDIIADKQRELERSVKEREVLLQEVHHRVKNNLQIISSMISMQARRIERGPTQQALLECKARVLTIALIHEKLYQSSDYANVQFAEYVRTLAANVFHAVGISPGSIELEIAVEDLHLGIDRAIPCGLLVNELLTNAVKHAFPEGRRGKVRIELRSEGSDKIVLRVSDNGVGIAPDLDLTRTSSLGMRLVATLADQLRGDLKIETDHGSAFQVTFPVDKDAARA